MKHIVLTGIVQYALSALKLVISDHIDPMKEEKIKYYQDLYHNEIFTTNEVVLNKEFDDTLLLSFNMRHNNKPIQNGVEP